MFSFAISQESFGTLRTVVAAIKEHEKRGKKRERESVKRCERCAAMYTDEHCTQRLCTVQ